MKKTWLALIVAFGVSQELAAQPVPGDLFREYRWFHEEGDAGQAIRVGRKLEKNVQEDAPDHVTTDPMVWPHHLDLAEAVNVEVVAEKVLCHDGTTGLAIQVNDGSWYEFPESPLIPKPQSAYQHHTYPVVRLPLTAFKPGTGNRFRLRVDAEHPWNWPQNLINGLHVRVYYDPETKPHASGAITSIRSGDSLGDQVLLKVEPSNRDRPISRVDYIGLYEDVNLEGDGRYRQWHYLYFHGQLQHHLGSASERPFAVRWDTSWVPDQNEPMQISARMTDDTGLTWQTAAVTDLALDRPDRSVELCKPYHVPKQWVTRRDELEQHFDITGDLTKARAAQLVWCSWSPGYMRGISINGTKVFDREGPKYRTYYHRITLNDLSMLRRGRNSLTTAKTPKINGQMVHGMEVNWPGIMVLIQYGDGGR